MITTSLHYQDINAFLIREYKTRQRLTIRAQQKSVHVSCSFVFILLHSHFAVAAEN